MSRAIPSGTHFGRYQIRSLIGAGGMGEVYLAEDTQLGRRVAIKFLPSDAISDEKARKRLIREARAAATLDHPNICAIHEVGEADGRSFIVMQYVEGETLDVRIKRKPLELKDVLSIASQIADALTEAHAHGIIHRDIKPQNIMITARGNVKVMDFGLAKVVAGPLESEAQTMSLLTTPGAVLGTMPYMSPEQIRGEQLDARTDIFSLGVVLYETFSGRQPFAGESVGATASAILTLDPPPLARYAQEVPAQLQDMVSKALRKDREERYQVVKDMLLDLKSLKQRLEFEAELERSAPPIVRDEATTMSGQVAVEATAESAAPATSSAEYVVSEIKRYKKAVGLALATLAIIAAAAVFFYFHRTVALTEKDTILLADFVNTTGDAVFDGALKQALAVQLGQSPFLNIFPDERVQETLRFMNRPPDTRVTKDVAREICERQGLKAMLIGSIAPLGSHYVIALDAVNAHTGDVLAREQVEAESKEQVLGVLGKTAIHLREKLGESLSSIQKFDAPIEQATTPSLEALKAFSLGDEQQDRGKYLEALPFYERAIELDPNFALAHARLSTVYNTSGQRELSIEQARKAFQLRERVSERERLFISSYYYNYATREIDKAIESLDLWKRTYPRDFLPRNNLARQYNRIAQFEKAIEEAREAIRLNPNSASAYANLERAFACLDRFDEAKEINERALAQGLDSVFFHEGLYWIAFIRGDQAVMQQQIDQMSGRPEEYVVPHWQTATAGFYGQLRKAREFSSRSVDLVGRRNVKELGAAYASGDALMYAVASDCQHVKDDTTKALAIARTDVSLMHNGTALALCGELGQAQSLTDELLRRNPKDTLVNDIWVPVLRASIETHRGNSAQVIQLLQSASRYEGATFSWPAYLRGLAYLQQRAGTEATAEFQKIIDHRGWDLTSILYPLAHLGLARAAALAGDTAKSRKVYEDFFALWKDADPDIPILIEAKKEYEKVK